LGRAVKLLAVEDARARMIRDLPRIAPETIPLSRALARFLRENIHAARDQPPFAASAMDGWALRSADGAGPRKIVGESAAGHGFARDLGPGEAVRIFTGAPVPAGADAVVIQEDAARDGETVIIPAITEPRHIRPAGQDFKVGERRPPSSRTPVTSPRAVMRSPSSTTLGKVIYRRVTQPGPAQACSMLTI